MPTQRRRSRKTVARDGPRVWVSGAFFCKHSLIDMDGSLSAIQFVDQITAVHVGASGPARMPPISTPLQLVVLLKREEAPESLAVTLDQHGPVDSPHRVRREIGGWQLDFSGRRGGAIIVELQLQFDWPGDYWFDVRSGDILLSRIPIEVVYAPAGVSVQRIATAGGAPVTTILSPGVATE